MILLAKQKERHRCIFIFGRVYTKCKLQLSLDSKNKYSYLNLCVDLETVKQSEISQKEKNEYHILMHICEIQKNGTDEPVAQLLQSCPTLCNPIDYSLPGSPVHEIFPRKNPTVGFHFLLQRIFLTQDQTHVSHVSCNAGEFFTTEPPEKLH